MGCLFNLLGSISLKEQNNKSLFDYNHVWVRSIFMNNKAKYFLLSIVFILVFLVLEFTDIYGDPKWFKIYTIIVFFSFFIGGLSIKR